MVWCPEDVYIEEPGSLIDAYLEAARRAGVQVLPDEPVIAEPVAPGPSPACGRTPAGSRPGWSSTPPGPGSARSVSWPGRGWRPHRCVTSCRVILPAFCVPAGAPITRILDCAVYLRPARGGLMLGGFEAAPLPLDPRAEAPGFDTDDVPLDRGVLDAMAAQVADLVPAAQAAVREGTVAEHRGGLFTMSPDGRFLAGPVPEAPGLWVASGCNGSGFSSSPAIGEALARWITGGRPPVGHVLPRAGPVRPGRRRLASGLLAAGPESAGRHSEGCQPGGRQPDGTLSRGGLSDEALVERGTWQYAHYYDPLTA